MELNQAQHKAIRHKEGPALILAGPGSGKTLVITERTKNLIHEHGVSEENILVITFTRAAAGEMKNRFLMAMGMDRTGVSFGTFHSVFFTILKHAYNLGPGNIIREDERLNCVRNIVHGMGLDYEDEKEFLSDVLSEISLVKGNRIDISDYYSISCSDGVFRRVFKEYNKRIRSANRIDFDDMLLLCYELLDERSDILKSWQDKFRYILIDEFQDINILQYDIIKMLASPRNNLFIVGDDDQSIYRFRGAKPEIMLNFPKDYPDCKRIILDINYRSNIDISKAASNLISHNKIRFEKKSHSNKKVKGQVVIRSFDTMAEQNQDLALKILELYRGGASLSDMAILVRTNMGSGAILHKLMEYNIPFNIGGNLPNIYEHWITQDLLSYIKISIGDKKRSHFLRIINRPKRYINRDCLDTSEVDFDDIKEYYEDKEWMLERIDQLEYDLSMIATMKPFAAIQYIRRGVGYDAFLREYAGQRKMASEELYDILDEVQESTREFSSFQEWFAYMDDYKEELKRQVQNKRNKKSQGVNIMTMHGSKGLEFDFVFLVDVNEDIIPHKKAVLPEDIEEERRLFYVAMTRAKESIYIFSPKQRYNKDMKPSRFIEETSSR